MRWVRGSWASQGMDTYTSMAAAVKREATLPADMPIEAMWRHIRVQLDRFGSADQTRQLIASALIDN